MKKLFIISIFFLLSTLIQSCSNYYQNLNNGIVLKKYENRISGTYILDDSLSNGKPFQLVLNSDNSFIEKNYFCTLYGRWHVNRDTSPFLRLLNSRFITLDVDTIISDLYLHYDDTQKWTCWYETMYFYQQNDSNYLEFCDRFGERINMNYINVCDSNSKTLIEYDHKKNQTSLQPTVSFIELPKETKSISIFGGNDASTYGICNNYCIDSGSVCFIHLQHLNDKTRVLLKGKKILYMPYDCHKIRKARILSRSQ